MNSAAMQLRRAARVILVGAPGVGKGTQTERMMQHFPQLSSISSGDLLRDNVRNKTALGIQAEAIMKSGALLPDKTILRLITSELVSKGWLRPKTSPPPYSLNYMVEPSPVSGAVLEDLNALDNYATAAAASRSHIKSSSKAAWEYSEHPEASFILDGFPRNASQAKSLASLLPINMVIHLKTPFDVILDRICNRWVHLASGRVYNTTFNAPRVTGKDDVTGEALVQRDDDKPETWHRRLAKFEESSQPLLEHYDQLGVLWTVEGKTSDEITPKLLDEFTARFGAESLTT